LLEFLVRGSSGESRAEEDVFPEFFDHKIKKANKLRQIDGDKASY
jgi:hypothetical protein